MDSALIVSFSEKGAAYLARFLKEMSMANVAAVSNAAQARRLVGERDFDLCIVNAPLPDEYGDSLAREISGKGISQVILLVKSEIYDKVSAAMEESGVITISKPINRTEFRNALKLARAIHRKLRAIQDENKKLIQKIEDIRIVDRAKCILISHLSMSEPEAHRYIEKQAMDTRTTRRAVAEKILRTYEN